MAVKWSLTVINSVNFCMCCMYAPFVNKSTIENAQFSAIFSFIHGHLELIFMYMISLYVFCMSDELTIMKIHFYALSLCMLWGWAEILNMTLFY